MLERLTGKLLSRFLSKYFILSEESNADGVTNTTSGSSRSPSKTQLAVWSGFLSFQHLQLRSSIVNDVFQKKGLPFELCSGFVDRVEINVPWGQLRSLLSGRGAGGGKNKNGNADGAAGSDAEIVLVLDGLYVLLNTRYEFNDDKLKDSQRVQRRKELDEAVAYVADGTSPDSESSSYFKSYVKNRLLSETFLNEIFDTLTNGIQVHIRNVHIRVEDLESDPSRPCCFGLTVESLHLTSEEEEESAVDDSDSDNGTAKTKKKKANTSLEKILARKVMQVNQLSIYCNAMDGDSNDPPQDGSPRRATTNLHSPELLPLQAMSDQPILLSRAMHTSIPRRRARSFDGRINNEPSHTYLLYPVDATSLAVLSKPNKPYGSGYNKAKLRSETNVTSFQIGINPSTIGHLVSFHARLKHHNSLKRHRFYRPTVSISSNPRLWWKYIARVVRRELREAGNVRRGWSWVHWYERVELRKRYTVLYERWLDHGVAGEGAVIVHKNGIEHADEDTVDDDASNIEIHAAISVDEYEEMRAIENATVDDEISVKDILLFRAMVHSKRQKQVPAAANSTNKAPIDSQYRLTRILRRIVTSEDLDEEYSRLLSYLEKKEEEEAAKRKQEYQESARQGVNGSNDKLCVVISMETVIREGSLSLFSERERIFDVALNTLQSKISMLENFDSVIFEASIHDCMGREYQANSSHHVVFSRSIHCEANDNPCKQLDKLLLPEDMHHASGGSQLQWSHYDTPLLDLNFVWHPPAAEMDAAIFLSFQKIKVLLDAGFNLPQRCKKAFSTPPSNKTLSADWEDLSIAYINSWESTKKSLAAKAERALQKRRKIDVTIDVYSPVVFVSDGVDTTLAVDLGHAHLSTEQLAGVRMSAVRDHHNDITPKKTNISTPYSRNSSESKGYLFTPNKRGNGPSPFLSPAPRSIDNRGTTLDISSIFESPYDNSSMNGSIESAQKRTRGWSIGNSKLFSVAENEEATVSNIAPSQQELIKCFYDNYRLSIDGVVVSISTSRANTNVFELPLLDSSIGKSTIPSDHSLCKLRISCVVELLRLDLSNESILGIESLYKRMKHAPSKTSTAYSYSGSHIFPVLPERIPIADDESSVNEDEFLDAIDEPDDANQWFNDHWLVDEETSVGEFTYDASFVRTPSSRRHRFPSISEVSGDEPKVYLSADNLLKLDESLEHPRRRSRSYSQISGDDDSFQSAVSNQDELVKAIQEDINQCESDIALTKSKIKSTVEEYNKNWRNEDTTQIKYHRHHKRKLKSELLRLEAELNALQACYRDIVVTDPAKLSIEPLEDSIIETAYDTQQDAFERAKALIVARKMRESVSPTKNAHHTLAKLNRDLHFVSVTISSVTLVVSECDEYIRGKEREIVSLHLEQLSFSSHHRQIDKRLRFGLDRLSASAPGIGTIAQCGYLDESAIARRAVKVDDESYFIRSAAELRKNKSLSKLKLKLKVGSTELAANSLVEIIPSLKAIHVGSQQTKPAAYKPPLQASDPMTKIASAIMGCSDVAACEEQQSYDIDFQFNSLHISIADCEDLSLLSVSGMNMRLARRLKQSKSRGQVDFGLSNFQLHYLSMADHARELFGCLSSFDQFLQGRIRMQSVYKYDTGGWCVGAEGHNVEMLTNDLPDNDELCWNIHFGIRCPATIILVTSPDLSHFVSSTKRLRTQVSSKTPPKSPNVECHDFLDQSNNIPVRWRLDYSMLEVVAIIPGKNYNYSSSMYFDAGSHLRISNSIRLCIQPDQLRSGNVSIDISARSYAVLNEAPNRNIVEPFTLSLNAIAQPHVVKMKPLNVELGVLDIPTAWAADSPATNVTLADGLDISMSIQVSPLSINVSHHLFVFTKELNQLQNKKTHGSYHQPHHPGSKASTKQALLSLDLKMASTCVRLDDSAQYRTSFLVESIRIGFVADSQQISTTISSGEVGLFFTEGSLTLPVFYSMSLLEKAEGIFPASLLLNVKLTKNNDDSSKSLEVSVKTGGFYITVIPSFIKEFSQLLAKVKGGKRKESPSPSQVQDTSVYPVSKIRQFGSFVFTIASEGLHLVLPSQDVRVGVSDSILNTICLSWSEMSTVCSLKALDANNTLNCQDTDEKVVSFKCDLNANCCLTRTAFTLANNSDESVGLPVTFRTSQEQIIVSPISSAFNTSMVMTANACSIGIHLDVGDVDVLWHASKSRFGISDALKLSVIPLLKKEEPHQQPAQPRQTFDSLSLQATSPIQHIDSSHYPSSQVKIPDRARLLLKDAMIVSSARIAKIQVTLVPSNAKEVSSPIMAFKVNAIRIGTSILRCPSSGGISIAADSKGRHSTSFIYSATWCDFELSVDYHNRRLVVFEPLVEAWAGNVQCCINFSEVLGMGAFLDAHDTGELPSYIPDKSDINRLSRLLEGMKHLHKNRYDQELSHQADSSNALSTSLDICHHMQCLLTPQHLERALHPLARLHGIHAKHHFIHWLPSTNEVSARISLLSGRVDTAQSKLCTQPTPLNINLTGALIENIGLMLSERSDVHIAPHYIINQTGLIMCWKPDNMINGQSSRRRIQPGGQEELRCDSFPHRSFIHIELYSSKTKSPSLKPLVKIDVDMVGTKRYTLKCLGKLTDGYVIVRTQLIGTAKVVSVESPVWILNASSIPCQLLVREYDEDDLFDTAVSPRSETGQNNMPKNAIPLPVDIVSQVTKKRVIWYLSTANINTAEERHPVKIPLASFSKEPKKQGRLQDTQLTLPFSMYQDVSLRLCSLRIGSSNHEAAARTCIDPEQRLIVFQNYTAFRNHLPYPVAFELCTVPHKKTNGNSWVNVGEAKTGNSIYLPFVKKEDTLEFRIKINDSHGSYSEWSSSVCLASSYEEKDSFNQLILSGKNGAPLQVSVGIQVNDASKNGTLLDQMKSMNDAYREIFIYVPSILIDLTGQNLEFMSGNAILRQQDDLSSISLVDGFEAGTGLSKIQTDIRHSKDAAVYMIGNKSAHLAIRQSTQNQTKSPWSSNISTLKGKTRIIVPRPTSPISRPLILCSRIEKCQVSGGRYTTVVTLQNQYSIVNQLPIDIDVISTTKSGKWLKRKPLVVLCNNNPVPLHFDDNGFIRFRPKEIGWSYSGLISVRRSSGADIAMRLRNKLTGKALIITIEFRKRDCASISIIVRRSRAVPFRIENLSTVPLQFAQQQSSPILRTLFNKYADSTVLLPYHQADYAWDELECRGGRYIYISVADLDFGHESTSLGRFYLDLIPPGKEIKLAHSSFKACIIADGPTRVLKITDSTLSVISEQMPSNSLQHQLNYECSLCIDVGVSVIDWRPQELMYLFIEGLSIHRHVSGSNDKMQCSISNVSADCSMWITQYPVLFKMAKVTRSRMQYAVRISLCRDTNDALGKDITLLRHASVELGKLIFKIDGSLVVSLVDMSKMATKLLKPQPQKDQKALNIADLKQPNQDMILGPNQSDTAASAAKVQPDKIRDLPTSPKNSELDLPRPPKHKYYIEHIQVSTVRAEISYCGRTPLPIWLSPAFMFEALPIRFSSYSNSYVYGSAKEHLESIKQHYNLWRFLFGLSLRPLFFTRAIIFTTKQSISVISQQASTAFKTFFQMDYKHFETGADKVSSNAIYNAATALLLGPSRLLSLVVSPLNLLFNEVERDERVRAPRLFAKTRNTDVLLDYVEGENEGRALLSRVREGRHLFEGYVSHGDLHGIGENKISSYDSESFSFILTTERLLILKNNTAKYAPPVLWDVEVQSIVLVEADELPLNKLVLQILHLDTKGVGLNMLSPKLLLFNGPDIGRHVLELRGRGQMKRSKVSPDNEIDRSANVRTVSADPGLLSNEELLEKLPVNRRFTLEQLIANDKLLKDRSSLAHMSRRVLKKARKRVRWFVDHAQIKISYDDFMMAVTLFVLFGDDVRILCFQPSADGVFAFFTSLSFILFVLEMILHTWVKSDFSRGIFRVKGYAFSFFFWLDLLAVLSMIPDVAWLASGLGIQSGLLDSFGTRAGKAGKIGAKSSRIIRMARLVRLVKLYKVTSQRNRERQQLADLRRLVELGHFSHDEIQEYMEKNGAKKQSKVGAELSDIITRRVIIAVLLMLCVVPLLTYSSPVDDANDVTLLLHKTNIHAGADCAYLERSTDKFRSFMEQIAGDGNLEQPLLVALDVNPKRCENDTSIDFVNEAVIAHVRDEALRVVATDPTVIEGVAYSISATFNETAYLQRESTASIYLMLFVLVMLIVLSTQFTGDAQRLVLAPIENMMSIVNMVADDPLEVFDFNNAPGSGDYETQVIQLAIEKITALLRIGFGVAGAEIISSNMAVEGGGSACLNPMIPGKRVYALFGFCDIMSFDLCTEKLEDEIMTFVNSVARIVHDEVTRWGGTCNKNLGNAFLMVWRIGDEKSLTDYRRMGGRRNSGSWSESHSPNSKLMAPVASHKTQDIDLQRIPGLDVLSDKALVGFLKVIVEINRDVQLLTYRNDKRLSSGGDKGFLLRMGFGLHAGWAIEGAVGSLQKVDATYLSPHVNMAARMEAATRQFGVSILITRSFFKLMSETAQGNCRKVDVVSVKGSNVPMPIYTYDTFQKQVFPQLRAPKYSNLSINEVLSQQAEQYDVSTWMADPDLIQLRCLATPEFVKTFDKGLKYYLEGNWADARTSLKKADQMMASNDIGGDGPSRAILKYMEANDWTCPSTWAGHRPLTSK